MHFHLYHEIDQLKKARLSAAKKQKVPSLIEVDFFYSIVEDGKTLKCNRKIIDACNNNYKVYQGARIL